MRRMFVETLALSVMLSAMSFSHGQQPATKGKPSTSPGTGAVEKSGKTSDAPSVKSGLEVMLEQALRNNPDIRVAEAKVRAAQEEFYRTRLTVTNKIAAKYVERQFTADKMGDFHRQWLRDRQLYNAGGSAITKDDVKKSEEEYARYQALLVKIDLELPYLLGKSPLSDAPQPVHSYGQFPIWLDAVEANSNWTIVTAGNVRFLHDGTGIAAKTIKPSPMTERIRVALAVPTKVNFKKASAREVLRNLFESVNLPYQIKMSQDPNTNLDATIEMSMKEEMPLLTALQLFQDNFGTNIRFYVRDYGILVTDGKSLPEGAVSIFDFAKAPSAKVEPPKETKPTGNNPGQQPMPPGAQ